MVVLGGLACLTVFAFDAVKGHFKLAASLPCGLILVVYGLVAMEVHASLGSDNQKGASNLFRPFFFADQTLP